MLNNPKIDHLCDSCEAFRGYQPPLASGSRQRFVLTRKEVPRLVCNIWRKVPVVPLVINAPEDSFIPAARVTKLGNIAGLLLHYRLRSAPIAHRTRVNQPWRRKIRSIVQHPTVVVGQLILLPMNHERRHRPWRTPLVHRVIESSRHTHHTRNKVGRLARQVHHEPTTVGHARSVDAVAVDIEFRAQFMDDLPYKIHILTALRRGVGCTFPGIVYPARVHDNRLISRSRVREARVVAIILRRIVAPSKAKENRNRFGRVIVRGNTHDRTTDTTVGTGELDILRSPWLCLFYCGRLLSRRRRCRFGSRYRSGCRLGSWSWRGLRRRCRSGRRCRFGSWRRLSLRHTPSPDKHGSKHRHGHCDGNGHEHNKPRSFHIFNRSHMSHKSNSRGNGLSITPVTRRFSYNFIRFPLNTALPRTKRVRGRPHPHSQLHVAHRPTRLEGHPHSPGHRDLGSPRFEYAPATIHTPAHGRQAKSSPHR